MTNGSRAAIRCKATYAVNPGGDAVNIDCASDSYRVNLVADVLAQGTVLSGRWRETTRQVQGSVSGQVPEPGRLQASLEGTGFGMQFSARSVGWRQSIPVRSEGTDVQGTTIKGSGEKGGHLSRRDRAGQPGSCRTTASTPAAPTPGRGDADAETHGWAGIGHGGN